MADGRKNRVVSYTEEEIRQCREAIAKRLADLIQIEEAMRAQKIRRIDIDGGITLKNMAPDLVSFYGKAYKKLGDAAKQ